MISEVVIGTLPHCKSSYSTHDKGISKPSQENFSGISKNPTMTAFGERLRQAFDGAKNKEIAQKLSHLGVYDSTITDYMKGKSFPDVEKLLEIYKITKFNLHWLLTGEGEGDQVSYLTVDEKKIVHRLAGDADIEFEQMLGELVEEALVHRCMQMLERYKELDAEERALFFMMSELLRPHDANEEESDKTSKRSLG